MPKLVKRGATWHYSFTVAGRRIRKSAGTADPRLARDIAAADERRHRLADAGQRPALTFGEAAALYLDDGGSPRFLLKVLDAIGHRDVAEINGAFLRDQAMILYPAATAATRNRQVLVPAQAVINHAADRGRCQPIRVRRFAEQRIERPAGDWPWIAAFMAANAAEPRVAAMAVFMFTTACRIGAACRIRWDDVNLQAGTVMIPAGKNLPPRAAALLPEAVAALAAIAPRQPQPQARVFGFSGRSTAHRAWRRCMDRAAATGLARLTAHEAGRHGFGTQALVRAGVDARTAADMGGWKSPRMLLERYAHSTVNAELVARVFGHGRKGRT